tara:strand:- start:105 stop:626 length:522 start_codon:yes stop_codon:yes gene_type:complete
MRQINISKKNIFLTLCGFEMTWFACVIGDYKGFPSLGIILSLIYLTLFFYFANNRTKAIKVCLKYSVLGIIFDSFLSYSGLYVINSSFMFGFIPIWLVVLWISFSTLFVDILIFLKKRRFISFLAGFLLVPPTYYVGIVLNIAKSNNLFLTILTMAIFWGALLYIYSITPNEK